MTGKFNLMIEIKKRSRVKGVPGVLLGDIPGFSEILAAAESQQYRTRENSLLNLTYDLRGTKVRTMTIRDYVLLDRIASPFLRRIEPSMSDLAMFLWILSPQFPRWVDGIGWRGWLFGLQPAAAFLHGRKVYRMFGSDIPKTSEPVVVEAFKYIDEMFFDSPPALNGSSESCISYLTSWFDTIQKEYHMPTEEVWKMGMPELFQRLNAIRQRNNPTMPTFNKKTDELKAWILLGLRKNEFTIDDLISGKVKFPFNN